MPRRVLMQRGDESFDVVEIAALDEQYGRPGRGPTMAIGLGLAIEPMNTLGDPETDELDDGWTVITGGRLLSSAFRTRWCSPQMGRS